MNNDLNIAAKLTIQQCLNVKKGEKVIVVIDTPQKEIGRALFEASLNAGAEAALIEMAPRANSGVEPPEMVAAAMLAADVALLPTSMSLSHTAAAVNAFIKGVRIASMPKITTDMMARTLNIDYAQMAERCEKYAAAIEEANKVHITSPAGTDVYLSLKGRKAHQDKGLYHVSGTAGNLPAGEVYAAPLEGTAEGIIVFDGSMADIGVLKEPLVIKVKDGYAVEIKGKDADALKVILEKHGKNAYNIAEFGLGMNPKATITGIILEDEKVLGTVHIALGDNSTMGGNVKVESHLDGLIRKPTVEVDGKVIMEDGKLIL
jgi:leucyl aminopeptidase (aminopeptidase T)